MTFSEQSEDRVEDTVSYLRCGETEEAITELTGDPPTNSRLVQKLGRRRLGSRKYRLLTGT